MNGRRDAQLHPQENCPDGPHAAGHPDTDVRRHPVCARRTGRAGTRPGTYRRRGVYKARGDTDAKQIEELKKLYGFDKPAPVRYLEMLRNFAHFDLGRSFAHDRPVWA